MTHEEEKMILKNLKKELEELEATALINKNDKFSWLMYNEKPYQVDKNALLSKIFIAEQRIAVTQENLRFRKSFKRSNKLYDALENIKKIIDLEWNGMIDINEYRQRIENIVLIALKPERMGYIDNNNEEV